MGRKNRIDRAVRTFELEGCSRCGGGHVSLPSWVILTGISFIAVCGVCAQRRDIREKRLVFAT